MLHRISPRSRKSFGKMKRAQEETASIKKGIASAQPPAEAFVRWIREQLPNHYAAWEIPPIHVAEARAASREEGWTVVRSRHAAAVEAETPYFGGSGEEAYRLHWVDVWLSGLDLDYLERRHRLSQPQPQQQQQHVDAEMAPVVLPAADNANQEVAAIPSAVEAPAIPANPFAVLALDDNGSMSGSSDSESSTESENDDNSEYKPPSDFSDSDEDDFDRFSLSDAALEDANPDESANAELLPGAPESPAVVEEQPDLAALQPYDGPLPSPADRRRSMLELWVDADVWSMNRYERQLLWQTIDAETREVAAVEQIEELDRLRKTHHEARRENQDASLEVSASSEPAVRRVSVSDGCHLALLYTGPLVAPARKQDLGMYDDWGCQVRTIAAQTAEVFY